ncbi:hypothetical protein [Streptomyces rubradiris]|uniref:Uncharacterized protein n=1 Tax=Streptomyces rubradiris TaxID=285531 RepID=A0ABQ3R3E1_STRRR|nr:hypothetical protein [Streptomyces rubradiris]GHH30033.1 hypothetical protein GCM10018792_75930 [Streptomyces rubradiris]GHI50374.1 hypothetical protein Srubr_02200 [Streptomyces rubradiris]
MTTLFVVALILAWLGGYGIGRGRPVHRALNWANWQLYSTTRATGLRRAAVWTLLSVENIAWLITHPVQGWHAWQHRNDPLPPRSPAVTIRRTNDTEETA